MTVDRVYVRRYLQDTLAAHLSGTCASRAGGAQEARYQELEPGDEIGKDGVELTYDHVLRGVNGPPGSPSTRRACRAASRPA